MSNHPLGCLCKDCMMDAYNSVLDDPEMDNELKVLICEIVLEDYDLYEEE